MTQEDIIQTILKDSNYDLDQFSEDEIDALKQKVFPKKVRGKEAPHVNCIVRKKDVQLKPEEIVRQLYTARLMERYGYSEKRLAFEHPVSFGLETKKADVVIFDKDRVDTPYIIVELKKPKLMDGKEQLHSYCHATGAPIGVWTNGEQISYYNRKDPNHFVDITDIPKSNQTLEDILKGHFKLKDLVINDKLANERKSLKDLILELENDVLANAGVDGFEEVFKLIFTKLYDEFKSKEDKTKIEFYLDQNLSDEDRGDFEKRKECLAGLNDNSFRSMEFRNTGQTDAQLQNKIQGLFNNAIKQWPGVFPEVAAFELTDTHLAVCVSRLQDVKLFNSNLLIIDEAFEYLISQSAKGQKGQYFTPAT